MTEKIKQLLRESCKSEKAYQEVLEALNLEKQVESQSQTPTTEYDLFELIFEHSSVGVGLMNVDYRILKVNKAFEKMLGYSQQELLLLSPDKITHPQDWLKQVPLLESLFQNQINQFSLPKRYITKDGREIWVRIHVSRFEKKDGQKYSVVVAREITEEKQIEEQLKESESRYRQVVESQTEFVTISSADMKILFANRAFLESFGINEEQIVGKYWYDFTPTKELKEIEKTIQSLRPEFPLMMRDDRNIFKDGSIRWIQWISKGFFDQNGKLIQFHSIGRDITRAKEAELKLKVSEEKYRTLIETQTDFVLVSTPETLITFANPSICNALGIREQDVVGKRWIDFALPEDVIDIEKKIRLLTLESPTFIHENRDLRKNEEIGWTQWINRGVFNHQGALVEIRSVGRDITEIKNAQLKLNESETKLKAIQNSTTDSIILISVNHTVLSINTKASSETAALLGQELKEGDDFREILKFFKPAVSEIYFASFNKALKGEVVDFEYEIDFGPFKNWYHYTYFPVYDRNETLIGICFRTIDISERKQIGLTFEKQQSLLREMSSLAKVGSWEFDLISQEINWSEETFHIYERPLFKGNPTYLEFRSMHTPEHFSKLESLIASSIKNLLPYKFESVIHCSSGAKKAIRALGKPVIENGKAVKLVGYIQDITELKRQESESISLQIELADILENTSEGYIKLNRDRQFVYANHNFEKMIRVEAATIIGKKIWDVFPEAINTNFFTYYEKTILEKSYFKFQEYFAPLSMWFEVSSYPSKDGGLTAFFRDISNEKEREKALIENQDFLQSIYYGINTPIFVFDVEGYKQFRFAGLNPAFEFGYGIKAYQFNGKLLSELSSFQIGDLNKMIDTLQLCIETGTEISFEEKIIRDGEPRYFITRINPLRDNGGDIYRLIGSSIDITERKLAEEKLLQNEAMLSETERIAKIGSWSFDVASGKIKWSKEVFSIFDHEEAKGVPSFEEVNSYFFLNDQKIHRKTVQDSIKHAEPYELTLKISTSQCEKWILIVGKVETNETNSVTRLFGTVQDVTQSVESKNERDMIYQQLLQSQKMESVGVLASGVAHEFNNILMGILGNAELLVKEFDGEPRKKKRVSTIIDNSHRASNIIRQMLGFARQGKSESTSFHLGVSLQSIIDMFEPTLNKRIKVRYSPPNELPLIFGDKGQIEQAILNIAVNAVDAISSKLSDPLHFGEISFELKHGPLPVRYSTPYKIEPSEKFIHLHIRDNGTGIPEHIQEKIFEPFFTTKDVGKGTGLGLAMVYGIIKNHNGYIFVESQLGEGTSFHIFLPPDYSQHRDTTPSKPLEIQKTDSARILVVDDEAMIRSYLSESLTAAGFSIETAVNGLEACQAVANSPKKYDLILIDRNMPELNGEESIARIREITTYPKLIMMTGYLENNRFEELERLGVSFIIQKPFTFEKLIEIISLALKR